MHIAIIYSITGSPQLHEEKKGGKKPQRRKVPEDLKKQREHKTHVNYIPLASGFFLKRFIFSSGVSTPLLLSFPTPRPPPPPPPTTSALRFGSQK
jgi:hypothetical protein